MKNKKGFTLIELLAVIVILAVLMVVAVPQILNVIEKSKESAASSSIKLVKDAIKTQVSTSSMSGTIFEKVGDCYLFDFDNRESGNANKLTLKNKDQIGGSIKYCNGKFESDTLTFDGTSVSGGETAKVCKRVTKNEDLHREECKQTDLSACIKSGYAIGDEIIYGNLGTSGTLSSGDAFDCDVNGDGTYDSTTERFYYVTDLESDSENYAVLIYYNNVSGGEKNNTATYAYVSSDDYIAAGGTSSSYGSYGNWNKGPLTAIKQLPSTRKWSKVSLTNTTRNIKDETGTERIGSFNYSGYAARLLTAQEVNRACGITVGNYTIGELKNCNYLMENTKYSDNDLVYGYSLETPLSSYSNVGLFVIGSTSRVKNSNVCSDSYGVRPAIEVLKSNISY